MASDDKCTIFAISFWIVVCILIVVLAGTGVRYICVKTSSSITSYQDNADNRKIIKEKKIAEAKVKVDAQKRSFDSRNKVKEIEFNVSGCWGLFLGCWACFLILSRIKVLQIIGVILAWILVMCCM
jgi:hypothetical protein